VLQKVADKNYEKIIGGASVALLDFVSAWCSTCKHLEGIIEELSMENIGRVLMAKVDVSDAPKLAQKFGVLGVPTVVFLRNGKPVHQVTFTGVVSKEKISQLIEQHLGV
jgi:thioredoxin 1